MYKTDNKFIADYCKASPQNLAFCHAGVQATIQQNTENLDNIMSQYKYKGINIPVFEWEQKKKAVLHFNKNKQYYYDNMLKILASKKADIPDKILKLFLEVEGLGLAKASFLAQLATGHKAFGCLDSNNLIWYGIDPKITDYNKKLKSETIKANRRKAYLDAVKKVGGGQKLWDNWCNGIADKSKKFTSGVEVSFKHRHWFTTRQSITSFLPVVVK